MILFEVIYSEWRWYKSVEGPRKRLIFDTADKVVASDFGHAESIVLSQVKDLYRIHEIKRLGPVLYGAKP